MIEKKTLSTGDIAKYCDVNLRTVARWINQGHLDAHKLPGRGNNRVTMNNFISFLKKHKMPIPREFQCSSKKILIVDDDVSMARSIQRALRKFGFETAIASDGFQAGLMLGNFKPSLITLDLQMPGANGYDVIRLINKIPDFSSTKILVISALSDEELKKTLAMGAQDYLSKPFTKEVLTRKIKDLLNF